ncbi:hypothetical protein T492DRAFT_882462, partial [Pavlovales sp. CCMP2436]
MPRADGASRVIGAGSSVTALAVLVALGVYLTTLPLEAELRPPPTPQLTPTPVLLAPADRASAQSSVATATPSASLGVTATATRVGPLAPEPTPLVNASAAPRIGDAEISLVMQQAAQAARRTALQRRTAASARHARCASADGRVPRLYMYSELPPNLVRPIQDWRDVGRIRQALMGSPHRTTDGGCADFYLVPTKRK